MIVSDRAHLLDPISTLEELRRGRFDVSVTTRVVITDQRDGLNFCRYADKLKVWPTPPAGLHDSIRHNRLLLLAAFTVLNPPTGPLATVVRLARRREENLGCLASNVAGFLELDPLEGAETLEPIISYALTL